MGLDEFGHGEVPGIRQRLQVGAVIPAINHGDGDGVTPKGLLITGLIELQRGQVVEDGLAVGGIEMYRDGVEG